MYQIGEHAKGVFVKQSRRCWTDEAFLVVHLQMWSTIFWPDIGTRSCKGNKALSDIKPFSWKPRLVCLSRESISFAFQGDMHISGSAIEIVNICSVGEEAYMSNWLFGPFYLRRSSTRHETPFCHVGTDFWYWSPGLLCRYSSGILKSMPMMDSMLVVVPMLMMDLMATIT